MELRFFYVDDFANKMIQLDEDTSKHVISVLRMQRGEELLLTDGKGSKAKAFIVDDNRKRCMVEVSSVETEEEKKPKITIAISIIKNSSRFEWFLEKATEIGINEIIPLLCERTAKEKFRYDRMKNILVSAMLQSQQKWLPHLHEPTTFEDLLVEEKQQQKFIAHCLPEQKTQLSEAYSFTIDHSQDPPLITHPSSIILIGPEGDFTPNEIEQALQVNFLPVALGNTRLRTETAGIVAASILRIGFLNG